MAAVLLEVEVDSKDNANLFFQPLSRPIRGRFDHNRVAEPLARLNQTYYRGIPGQRLGLMADGTAYVEEPLHAEEFAELRRTIERQRMSVPEPRREEIPNADKTTWLYWLKRAVDAGCAVVTRGSLPTKLEGKPQTSFLHKPQTDDRDDTIKQQQKMIQTQNEQIAQLLARVDAMLAAK